MYSNYMLKKESEIGVSDTSILILIALTPVILSINYISVDFFKIIYQSESIDDNFIKIINNSFSITIIAVIPIIIQSVISRYYLSVKKYLNFFLISYIPIIIGLISLNIFYFFNINANFSCIIQAQCYITSSSIDQKSNFLIINNTIKVKMTVLGTS